MTIKFYPTIADMLHEMGQAKVVRLAEYRKMKVALGWKPDFEQFRAALRWKRNPKRLEKERLRIERREHNKKVVRANGLKKVTTKKKDTFND